MMVNTVLGRVPAEELGQTLMHEHITCADWSMRMNFGDKFLLYDRLVEMAVAQMKKIMDCGITTLVDGTAVNLGRDINLLRDVSEQSGINIVASSGFYYQEEAWLAMRDEGEIHDLLLDECLNGIAGTDSLPGIMKNGITAAGITPLQNMLLRTVGTVAREAGLPIFCHHDPAIKSGYDILNIYASVGVDPRRVVIGHIGDSNDWAYHEDMVKAGAYVGFDRLAYGDKGNTVENNVKNIIDLVSKGYADHIFLSHDWATYLAFWDSWDTSVQNFENGTVDFSFVSKTVIPMLRAGGLTAEDIEQIMVKNPCNFFNGN